MRNERLYSELIAWCEDKHPATALTAPVLAFSAHALDETIRTPDGDGVKANLPEISPEERTRFYQSMLTVIRESADAAPLEDAQVAHDLCNVWEEINSPDFDQVQLLREILPTLRDPEAKKHAIAEYQKAIRENCELIANPDDHMLSDSERTSLESSPAFGFIRTVVLDYLATNYRIPQAQYSKAIDRTDLALAPAIPLIANDPRLIGDPNLEHRLFHGGRKRVRARMALLQSPLSKGPRKLKKESVIRSIAGLISCISHLWDAPIEAPKIAYLFDLAARQRQELNNDNGIALEIRLPAGQNLTKRIYLEREEWMKWIDPDKKFLNSVRALKNWAA